MSALAGETSKRFTHGTHRVVEPPAMLARAAPLARLAGVTRLADITGLDRIGLPTVAAVRPAATTISVAAGKGLSQEAARVSALMEAIEVFHGETVRPPIVVESYASLSSRHPLVALEDLPVIRGSLLHPQLPEAWTFGCDIVAEQCVGVPVDLAILSGPLLPYGSWYMSSNGLASGAVFVEALLAALLEIVERDAVACRRTCARQTGRTLPRVDLTRSEHLPMATEVLAKIADADVFPIVYDCTVDTLIPVYLALLMDRSQRQVGIFHGSGAHLDPDIALVRALTEAAQSRALYIAGSRDDLFRREFTRLKADDGASAVAALESQLPSVDITATVSLASSSFESDVRRIVESLQRVGVQRVVVLELTLPEFGDALSVVRVIVPGLACQGVEHGHPSPRAEAWTRRAAACG